jgi:hypothetical protein
MNSSALVFGLWLCMGIISIAAEPATTTVNGTFTIPAEIATFQNQTVEILLFEYDPRIADKAADLIEKIELKDFSHTTGTETKKSFEIGCKGTLNEMRSYYLTFYILKGNDRTHAGDCEHCKKGEFLCKVLTNGQPNKINIKVRKL